MNDIFENNKQNLLLINEIVANYRKQNFFVGSLKLSALLKNINSVVEVIFSREDCRDLAGELEQILPALLQAPGQSGLYFAGRHSGRRFAAVATENTNKAAGRRHTAGFGLFGKQYVNPERKKRETLQSTSECAR